jgi:lysyl-tRNA synthetase class 2
VNTSPVANLIKRALFLSKVRHFFDQKGIIEVDTPLLNRCAPLDSYIDIFGVEGGMFLHSSPEYAMKKLLSVGAPDCYFLGHVFRVEEVGSLHSPEFTMIEYYRIGKSFEFLIQETLELISLFIPSQSVLQMTYEEAFFHFANLKLDEIDSTIEGPFTSQEKMHLAFATLVEPKMKGLVVVAGFPTSEAALSKIKDGLAQRFEIYFNGVELANGYDELTSSKEQRERFLVANQKRAAMGKQTYALDENFLLALDKLPDCVGVAIGFDRLLQIHLKAPSIHEVILQTYGQ